VNSAASLAAGLPVGRLSARCLVLAAYAGPAVAAWLLAGLCLVALPAAGLALAGVVVYGGYYGLLEVSGRRGLPPPGRGWQVPQSMLIRVSPRRRVLVWGALLGPGFATRNPYAGFGLLPLAVLALPGVAAGSAGAGARAGLTLAAAIGLAHGTARAGALLRDIEETSEAAGPEPDQFLPVPERPGVQVAAVPVHLDFLRKTVYWRRFDGAMLLAVAAVAVVASVRYFS